MTCGAGFCVIAGAHLAHCGSQIVAGAALRNRSSLKFARKTRVVRFVRMVDVIVTNRVRKLKWIVGGKLYVPMPEIGKGVFVAVAALDVFHLGQVEIGTLMFPVTAKTVRLRNIGAAGKGSAVSGLSWAAETVAAHTLVDKLLALWNECGKYPVKRLAVVRCMTSLAPVYRADARMNAGDSARIKRSQA